MLVHRIQEFTSLLLSNTSISEEDLLLLKNLVMDFSELDPNANLTTAQLRKVLQVFGRRWESIAGTTNEYDINDEVINCSTPCLLESSEGSLKRSTVLHQGDPLLRTSGFNINLEWIKLARDLESPANRTYLQILRPGIKNKRIQDFISTLLSEPDLNKADELIIKKLEDEFSLLNSDEFLSAAKLKTVKRAFANRWKLVADTQDDYTMSNSRVNSEWISLAHDLEGPAYITYLQILMPSIQNISDPNVWERHAATKRDLRSFVVGDDRKTLFRVWGLLDRLLAKKKFATYPHKKYVPRPLSVHEMLRIRSKRGDLGFGISDKNYVSFWDYLYRETIPNWHNRGEIPKHLLPLLLKVVEDYCESIASILDPSTFRKTLQTFADALMYVPIDDVNCLYGQSIMVHDKRIFLIELLIDSLQCEPLLLFDQMAGLARWLYHYDASLVVDHWLLQDSADASINAGSAFNLDNLQRALTILDHEASTEILKLLKKLMGLFASEISFDSIQYLSILDEIGNLRPTQLQRQLQNVLVLPPDSTGFNFSAVHHSLQQLEEEHASEIQKALRELLKQLHAKGGIDSDWIKKLGEVYRLRWFKIQGTIRDYTRLQDKENAEWIRLAQQLSGVGIIGKNYYRFLMPTLTHDRDSVTGEYLTNYPLSHYILSANSKSLILLDNSVQRYFITKTFYNCNSIPTRPFSQREIIRLQYAHKKFRHFIRYANDADKNINEPTISYTTLLALKALVDTSLFANGIRLGKNYGEGQITAAELAYARFLEHYNQLPEDEKTRLDIQTIHFHGYRTTFAELRKQVENGGCMAVFGLYIAQLVMDYAPYWRFREHIERSRINVEAMRVNSRKKIIRDYCHLSDKEAIHRIQLLSIFILTNSHTLLPGGGSEVLIWEFSHTVDKDAKAIFDLISPMLKSGNYDDARFLYAKIMATVVRPGITYGKWHPLIWQKDAASSGIHLLANDSLFVQSVAWYEPEFLFSALLPATSKITPIRQKLLRFLDALVLSYVQPQNSSTRAIRINLKFVQLINSIDNEGRDLVLNSLSIKNTDLEVRPFHLKCAEYLIHRVASRGAHALVNAEDRVIAYKRIKQRLEAHVLPGISTAEQAFAILNDTMEKFSREITDEPEEHQLVDWKVSDMQEKQQAVKYMFSDEQERQQVLECMMSYLQGMQQRIVPLDMEKSSLPADAQYQPVHSISVC